MTSRPLHTGDIVSVFADYRTPGCTDRRETVVAEVASNGMFFLDVTGARHNTADAELKSAPLEAPPFTLAAPAPAGAPAKTPTPLAPVDRSRERKAPNLLTGAVETWGIPTADGEWDFDREDDQATTWWVTHIPTGTPVKGHLGSLRACRLYVSTGEAQADLDLILACKRGEHAQAPAESCRECGSRVS